MCPAHLVSSSLSRIRPPQINRYISLAYGPQLSGGGFGSGELKFPDPFPKGSSRFRCRCRSSPIRKGPDMTVTPKVAQDTPASSLAPLNYRSSLQPDNPTRALTSAIVSIGSNTDRALDRFHLEDSLIPHLHTLVTTVRSSKWEEKLRGAEWSLSYEQAVTLSNALQADIGIAKLTATACQVRRDWRLTTGI